jgi:hypothetical protein
LRNRRDTRGHAFDTVRDREAPGSNPGPPTIFVFKTARYCFTRALDRRTVPPVAIHRFHGERFTARSNIDAHARLVQGMVGV